MAKMSELKSLNFINPLNFLDEILLIELNFKYHSSKILCIKVLPGNKLYEVSNFCKIQL